LRKFSQARAVLDLEGDDTRAIALLEEAIELDPEFASAWRGLGVIYSNRSQERSRQVEALSQAFEHRDRLTPRERYMTDAAYYSAVMNDRPRTIAAYNNILDLDPGDLSALNNLGIEYMETREWERAAELFERALVTDSAIINPYFNLGASRVALGEFDRAWEVVETARRHVPGHPLIDQMAVLTAAAEGDRDRAAELAEALARDHPADPFWTTWTGDVRASLAASEGRLEEASRLTGAVERQYRERGATSQAIRQALSRAELALVPREDPAGGLRALDEILARYPLEEMAPLDRPYIRLIVNLAIAEEGRRARSLLEAFLREVPGDMRAEVAVRRARGHVLIAEGRYDEAADQFRNPDADQCMLCDEIGLALAHERAGRPDSAAIHYARLAQRPWFPKVFFDRTWLGPSLERAARLYDELGDAENAARYYAMFVEAWAGADEELQPRVRAAQERLEEIVRARG
ncbi:MAG: tetratricopeptide repeat protein, partial [Gemmatimonadota bacterium]|nr:tetratricopeptide repeat protein [Gemmatimonadota bacterium]